MHGGMILCELGEVFIKIKYNGNGDDQNDGENISSYEFLYDIPVENT